jgi:hypothetical protein
VRPSRHLTPASAEEAIHILATSRGKPRLLAGGTTLIDLMKLDVHFAEVQIDPLVPRARVTRMLSVADCGRVLSRREGGRRGGLRRGGRRDRQRHLSRHRQESENSADSNRSVHLRQETLMEPSSNSLANTISFAGTRFLGRRVFAGHLSRTHIFVSTRK